MLQLEQAFVNDHCHLFQHSEENKLEYTDIHERYAHLVVDQLEGKVSEKDIAMLLEELPAYIASITNNRDKGVEVANINDADAIPPAIAQALLTALDFQMFKEMMLVAAKGDAASLGFITDAASSTSSEEQFFFGDIEPPTGTWEPVSCVKGVTIRELKGSPYVRAYITVDLSPMELFEIVGGVDNPKWVDWNKFASHVEILKVRHKDDFDVRMQKDMTGLSKIVPSLFMSSIVGRVRRGRDTPSKGSYTCHLTPDLEASGGKEPHFKEAKMIVKPVEADPKQAVLVVQETKSTWLPRWVSNFFITRVFPAVLSGMVRNYRKSTKQR